MLKYLRYYCDNKQHFFFCIKMWLLILLSVSAMKQSCGIGLYTVYCTFKLVMGICMKSTL